MFKDLMIASWAIYVIVMFFINIVDVSTFVDFFIYVFVYMIMLALPIGIWGVDS